MDLFILMGAGLLGAVFLTSQSDSARVAPLWQLLFGAGGGGGAFIILQTTGALPESADIGSFLFLAAIGGLSGAAVILLFMLLRGRRHK